MKCKPFLIFDTKLASHFYFMSIKNAYSRLYLNYIVLMQKQTVFHTLIYIDIWSQLVNLQIKLICKKNLTSSFCIRWIVHIFFIALVFYDMILVNLIEICLRILVQIFSIYGSFVKKCLLEYSMFCFGVRNPKLVGLFKEVVLLHFFITKRSFSNI